MDQLSSLLMAGFIIVFTIVEKKRLNTIITPFILSAWPFLLISLMNNFILIHFKYSPITARAQLFIMLNLSIIWVVGFIMYFFLRPPRNDDNPNRYKLRFKDIAKYQYIIILIAWITILLNLNRVYNLLASHGGIEFLADQRFEDIMSGGGGNFITHLVEVGKICYLLLIFTLSYAKNKYLYYITIIALLFSTAFIMVKYHVMWLILFTFFFFNLDKSVKKQLKTMVVILVILYLTMNLFWISFTLIWGTFSFENKVPWIFFIHQFLNYFVSGPIVLDKWLAFGAIKPDWSLFIVLINIINVLLGNPERLTAIPYMTHGFFEISPHMYSNVGTSFGAYYLVGGYILSFLIVTIFSVLSYFIYYKSKTVPSKILVFLNLLFLTLNMFNFFGPYFTLLTMYEMIFIFILFVVLFEALKITDRTTHSDI